jgi:hypothetical protein
MDQLEPPKIAIDPAREEEERACYIFGAFLWTSIFEI